eukprot:TRINITY_DN1896_c0_g1_i1.p1 TRINITY_DN1896_c0_g1~~TRINITY_DN1896_c0_g1_i1.p1  ORF type:complete len:350 (-),score=88.68 TRINITY_DN1896_c0_g1_i1:123-1172(-)
MQPALGPPALGPPALGPPALGQPGTKFGSSEDGLPSHIQPQVQMSEWVTYGAQLRAWVGIQVDEHLAQMLPSMLEARLAPLASCVVELQRETAELNEKLSKNKLQDGQQNIDLHKLEMRLSNLRMELDADIADKLRSATVAVIAEEAESRRQLEERWNQRLESLETKKTEVLQLEANPLPASVLKHVEDQVEALQREVRLLNSKQAEDEHADIHEELEARVFTNIRQLELRLRKEQNERDERLSERIKATPTSPKDSQRAMLEGIASAEQRLEEMVERRLEDYQRQQVVTQEKLLAQADAAATIKVKLELTKAFKAEAAAISALDERLKHRVKAAAAKWDVEVARFSGE